MCIVVNPNYAAQPDGSVRFKLMKLNNDGSVDGLNHTANGRYVSGSDPVMVDGHLVGSVRRAIITTAYDSERHGIHVCTDENEFEKVCRMYINGSWRCRFAKVKLECRGFLAGGLFEDSVNETWQEVTILSIEEVSNRYSDQ